MCPFNAPYLSWTTTSMHFPYIRMHLETFNWKFKEKVSFPITKRPSLFVRLLQQFTGFIMEKFENIRPPAEWAACDGSKARKGVPLL